MKAFKRIVTYLMWFWAVASWFFLCWAFYLLFKSNFWGWVVLSAALILNLSTSYILDWADPDWENESTDDQW